MRNGFTLIELSIVMGIMAILLGLSFYNISNLIPRSNVFAVSTMLVSDIRSQQHFSMTGVVSSEVYPKQFGIYFTSNAYTLFQGDEYSPTNTTNFEIPIPEVLRFESIQFPDNTVLFSAPDGDVESYVEGQNSLRLVNTQTNEFKTITLNKFGIPNIE